MTQPIYDKFRSARLNGAPILDTKDAEYDDSNAAGILHGAKTAQEALDRIDRQEVVDGDELVKEREAREREDASLDGRVTALEQGSGPGGGITQDAFNTERRARIARENEIETESRSGDKALGERLDAIPVYAAQMAVWPPNVRAHTDFQRKFQSTLGGLVDSLATNAGSTGTRFTNVFRIFARNADDAVIELHTQGWSFTNDQRQTIEWEVSAAEFNRLSLQSATNGIEVWGEFRAVYGGGVNEFRGRTNPVFIDFGDQDEWPATRGLVDDNDELRKKGDDLQSITVSTPGALSTALTAQGSSDNPLEIVVTSTFVSSGTTYNTGDILHVAPRSTGIEARFNAVNHGELNQEAKQRGEGDQIDVSGGVSSAAELTAALTSHRTSDSEFALLIVVDTDFTTSTRSYKAGQRWYVAPHHSAEGEMVLLSQAGGGDFSLSTAQEIGLLRFTVEPPAVPAGPGLADELERTFRVRVHRPDLVTTSLWVDTLVGGIGQQAARVALGSSISVPINATQARSIRDNFGDDDFVSFDIRLYDAETAGNLVDTVRLHIGFEQPPETVVQAVRAVANTIVAHENGDVAAISMTANITLNVTGGSDGDFQIVRCTQDATGGRTLTLNSAIMRNGPDAPVLSTGAGETDMLLFGRLGANWHYIGIVKDV